MGAGTGWTGTGWTGTGWAGTGWAGTGWAGTSAFGVFRRFQIAHFHFFFFVAILSFFPLSVCCLVDVSRTEKQLTAARDVPFRNEVIEPDQFFFFAFLLLNG